jgi:hypothetical protein
VLASTTAEAIVAGDWTPSTTAQRVQGGYRVSGHKYFVSQAPGMDLVRVAAADVDTGELLVLLIPAETPGVSVVDTWDTTGMRATTSHDLVLNDVAVSDAAVTLRAPPGAPMRQPASVVTWAEVLMASVYLGVAEEARAEALRSIGRGINSSARNPALTDVLLGELEATFTTALAVRELARRGSLRRSACTGAVNTVSPGGLSTRRGHSRQGGRDRRWSQLLSEVGARASVA